MRFAAARNLFVVAAAATMMRATTSLLSPLAAASSLSLLLLLLPAAAAEDEIAAEDQNENCEMWADRGECEINPDYMLVYCASSCARVRAEEEEEREDHDLDGVDSFYDLSAYDIDGNLLEFRHLRGRVVLITNVASYCGYTESHYAQLVELHRDLQGQAIEILAFPCNQFGRQEPGSNEEIKQFAAERGAGFRMMSKIDVNGPSAHPVYKFLKKVAGPDSIKWNFATYYIVDKEGHVESHSGIEPIGLKIVAVGLLRNEEL